MLDRLGIGLHKSEEELDGLTTKAAGRNPWSSRLSKLVLRLDWLLATALTVAAFVARRLALFHCQPKPHTWLRLPTERPARRHFIAG